MTVHFDGDALVYIAGFAADSRNGPFSHSAHNIKLIINKVLNVLGEDKYKVFLTAKDPTVNFRHYLIPDYKANRKKRCNRCVEEAAHKLLALDESEKPMTFRKAKSLAAASKKTGLNVSKDSYVDRISTPDGIMKRRFFTCMDCDGPVSDTKPVYYNKIRNYLKEKYGAWICTWGETDDWLHNGIVATHDKDLRMLPGTYINLKSYEVTEHSDPGEIWLDETPIKSGGKPKLKKDGTASVVKSLNGYGFKWFCAQMLMGDSVDNIPKPYAGDGDVYIHNMFSYLKTKKEMWEQVKFYYNTTGNADMLETIAGLLWVAREPYQQGTLDVIESVINE